MKDPLYEKKMGHRLTILRRNVDARRKAVKKDPSKRNKELLAEDRKALADFNKSEKKRKSKKPG